MTGEIGFDLNSGKAVSIERGGSITATIHSDGTFTTQRTEFNGNHLVTKNYVDNAIGDIDIDIPDVDLSGYLPLGGGQMTGPITSNRGAGDLAFRVETNGAHKLTIWNDGVIESTRTGFSDNHLVTKKYVDENAGGFTPGEQVAKLNSNAGVAVGGFYISNGNVYCKVS